MTEDEALEQLLREIEYLTLQTEETCRTLRELTNEVKKSKYHEFFNDIGERYVQREERDQRDKGFEYLSEAFGSA